MNRVTAAEGSVSDGTGGGEGEVPISKNTSFFPDQTTTNQTTKRADSSQDEKTCLVAGVGGRGV